MTNDRKKRAERAEQMRKEREKAEKRQRNVITVGIVVVVVALVAIGGWAISSTAGDNAKQTELVQPQNATDDYGIVYDTEAAGGEPTETEPVSVELYEDFQCPACRSFEQTSGAFLDQAVQAGDITITYRPFSFLDSMSLNEYSSRATNLAVCALDAGGVEDYKAVHDYLYANQPDERTAGPEDAELIEAAEGLGITGIEECVRTERFVPWIEEAADAGREAEVASTPTVLVDGEVVENPTPEGLAAAIEAAKAA